ncbi:MAG: ABC transporter permease [Bacillota bacterium]|nr:MAG: ABC transporter permease [Bacillota bacterium]
MTRLLRKLMPRGGQVDPAFALTVGLTIVASILALWICTAFAGASVTQVLSTMIEGALGRRNAVLATFAEFAPIALCGLGVLIPYRAGFFNIGTQGQLEVGALAAITVVLTLGGSPWVTLPLAFLAACAAGMAASVIPIVLKLRRGASEVTTTIMLNFTCVLLVYAMITGPLKDPSAFYGATPPVPAPFRLAAVPAGGPHLGVWIALAALLVFEVILNRTVFGTQVRAVGYNRQAALLAGVRVDRVTILAVVGGAAMAGLAGSIQVLGVTYRVAETWSKGWGFTGISVALLGGGPVGVLIVSAIFAILETGARSMQALTGVPAALVYLLQGIPVLVYLAVRSSRLGARKAAPVETGSGSEGSSSQARAGGCRMEGAE